MAARLGINISTLHFHVATKSALLRLVADTATFNRSAPITEYARRPLIS
nr:hypothetical protein [Rhodobacter capsulatus]